MKLSEINTGYLKLGYPVVPDGLDHNNRIKQSLLLKILRATADMFEIRYEDVDFFGEEAGTKFPLTVEIRFDSQLPDGKTYDPESDEHELLRHIIPGGIKKCFKDAGFSVSVKDAGGRPSMGMYFHNFEVDLVD